MVRFFLVWMVSWVGAICLLVSCSPSAEVSFNQQIRPILNARCVTCHGGVKRAANLNLLFRSEALGAGSSGRPAIVPGDAGASEVMRRIRHWDPAERMPKDDSPLAEQEVELLGSWIDQGAEWARHWAYVPLQTSFLPAVKGDWQKSGIDHFILRRLINEGLEPSPEASRALLIRRVSLDLIGLPPTPQEVDAFVSDPSRDAFEKVVDRLLASPRFGERWAALWMDLARYADTKGYERDPPREIWRYRDWLIRAFNRDLPYDQFTIEQLAGDLLPDPKPDQYVATAFHRNTMNNDEGGTDNEEYRVAAVIDRVNTTWDVWLGTTFSCTQCHGHPYDPFRQEEYYEVLSFFNNTRDEDTPNESPVYRFFKEGDQKEIRRIQDWVFENAEGPREEKEKAVARISELIHISEPKIHPHHFEIIRNGTHADTKYLQMYREGLALLPDIHLSGKSSILVNFDWVVGGSQLEIRLDSENGELYERFDLIKEQHKGHVFFEIPKKEGVHDLYFRFENPNLEQNKGTSSINWMIFLDPLPGENSPQFPVMREALSELMNRETESVPVMVENGSGFRRKTHLFERGNWLVKGQEVNPDVPDSLFPLPTRTGGGNRLDFARWLVSRDNPLTARVAVNRFWEQFFGKGLVETVEDFGTQGALPSHPELLDWLALRFVNKHQWSVKELFREIVLSATYRQSAEVDEEKLLQDPGNRLLSRGPRNRLTAEQVRDQALSVSGLLSETMFGPSVMPPQPEGVWQVIYSNQKWETSTGENRYRRALYTYWRRTSPYPSMVLFDAPSREFCVPRRLPTNTPLQALATLNDPVFLEAAAALAERMLIRSANSEERVKVGYRMALGWDPSAATLADLERLYGEALESQSASGGSRELVERRALSAVANSIMNLDEFLTK